MIRSRRVLARCPRCHGRLFFHSDQHGAYLSCLTCGCVLEERAHVIEQEPELAPAVWWRAQSA
jgi:transcription initiation factor TFIIIB Brf1 subunit/transcription initiation factor TFIIB